MIQVSMKEKGKTFLFPSSREERAERSPTPRDKKAQESHPFLAKEDREKRRKRGGDVNGLLFACF
jgi:hypothetical protein